MSEDEARNFANEIGAVFKLTSASTNQGIEELFKGVGCRVLDPNYSENSDSNENKKNSNIKLDEKNADKKKKKGCC